MTRVKNIFISALLFLLLLVPCTGLAHEITDQELTRLDQIFGQLEINNNALLNDLSQSKQDLSQARQKLEEYQKDLAELQTQLKLLRTESKEAKANLETAQSSLQKANQSLDKFVKEAKAEANKLRFERNLLFIVAGVLAFR